MSGAGRAWGLDLARLLVFVTVVERNGYSPAARHLELAQPTVSHHVHELERTVGADLLHYEQRAVHLTPAGHEVLRTARVMLGEQDQLVQALRDLDHGRRGRVRLGLSMTFEQGDFFARVIAPFCRAHEGMLLSVRIGHSPREARAVLDRQLDLAYVLDWDLPPEIEFEALQTATFTFLVPPKHPLTSHEVVSVDQIAEAGLITTPLSSIESAYYGRILRESGLSDEVSVLEVDGMQARRLAAEAGLGVFGTFLPDGAGSAALDGLVALPVEPAPAQVELGIVTRGDEPESASVRALTDWLRLQALR